MSDQKKNSSPLPFWAQILLLIGVPVLIFVILINIYLRVTTPGTNQPAGVAIDRSQTQLETAQVDKSQSTGTASSAQFNLNTDLSTNSTGETMKTLADFTPLSAKTATLRTNRGDITFELYADQTPLTVTNFLTLAQEGYYDNIKFHRVIENFMAQTGDPYSKSPESAALVGTGGPGYTIADEFIPELKHDTMGVVSMANTGQPGTGGSQFFITFVPTPWLDGKHTVFGKVTDQNSLTVLQQIKQDDVIFGVDFK